MRRFAWISLGVLALAIGIGAGLALHSLDALPQVRKMETYRPQETTRIYAADGSVLAELFLERRRVVRVSDLPRDLLKSVIAIEDARFYNHAGIDLWGILRAAWHNLRSGEIVEGGSTITQQLAKMLFLTSERSFSRKLREALLALQMEQRYSKEEILGFYLNQVYMGNGAYGVEAAAQVYFGKSARNVSLPEAALMAGIPRAPARYNPFRHPEQARQRRDAVLRRMQEMKTISKALYERARQTPLPVSPHRMTPTRAPYFVEHVRQGLEEALGQETYIGGLRVETTLDPTMQAAAENALQKGLTALGKRHRVPKSRKRGSDPETGASPLQSAVVVLEPATGHIKAMVGGTDFAQTQFNRAVQALRQPGSAFKTFVYLAALEQGFTPAHVEVDEPIAVPLGPRQADWKPDNFTHRFEGPVTLRHALARSINIVAVKVAGRVGASRVVDVARRLGIQSPLRPYPSLALGASDLTLMELTSAYGVLANQGLRMEPVAVHRVKDSDGRVLWERTAYPREAVQPDVAYLMTSLLQSVVKRGTAWRAKTLRRPIAGKTGTTNDFRDAWFIGYTPDLVAGVWVGYDDHRPLGNRETGARAALPIWLDLMKVILKDRPIKPFPVPAGIRRVAVDPATGLRATPNCPRVVQEVFITGTEPVRVCEHSPAPIAQSAERMAHGAERKAQSVGKHTLPAQFNQ